ncbi:MAG: FtsL-like putative cell division protein [Cyclobacteriaceae bacterium]
MSENKFRIGQKEKGKGPGSSIFSGLEKHVKLETYFEEGFPVKYLPKILFVLMLSLIYIGNTHYSEKTIRKINKTHTEVEDIRADYTTLKADLMFASKQSEVARRVKPLGLKESIKPPYKIVVKEGEY